MLDRAEKDGITKACAIALAEGRFKWQSSATVIHHGVKLPRLTIFTTKDAGVKIVLTIPNAPLAKAIVHYCTKLAKLNRVVTEGNTIRFNPKT